MDKQEELEATLADAEADLGPARAVLAQRNRAGFFEVPLQVSRLPSLSVLFLG